MALFSSFAGPPTAAPLLGISQTMLWLEILICTLALGAILALLIALYITPPIEQFSAQKFEHLGCSLVGIPRSGSAHSRLQRYKGHFGATPNVVANLWKRLAQSRWLFFVGVRGPKPEHLF